MRNKYRCKPYYKIHKTPAKNPGPAVSMLSDAALAVEGSVRAAGVADQSWSVPNLCAAYDWPSGNAPGGGLIAIVELGGGWVQSDMDAYFASIGQPSPSITDVSVDGTTNSPNQGLQDDPDVEVALDIQVAAAAYFVATGQPATIRVYWARDIATAVTAAMNDGCDVCSISWGADEAQWGKDGADQMEAAALSATQKGMIVLAASGDNDSSDGGPGRHNVDLPAGCPHVIGCGGTQKTATKEVVWNDNPGHPSGEGTGGGFSLFFPKQDFQARAPNGPGRMIPDVAGNADDAVTPYQILVHGQGMKVGGTSAVAPLYAGLFAAMGTQLGFISPTLWANQTCFNDIVSGDNGAYRAGLGPDPCSGIGSPIGKRLLSLLAKQ
jgi:kumamolisin